MKKTFKIQNGFTLIELMIVIAIIGILAAIAIPKFSEQIQKKTPPLPTTISVLYGTDRVRTTDGNFYGNRSDGRLSYGLCKVTIPPSHKRGRIEKKVFWKLQFSDDPNRDMVVVGADPLSLEQFSDKLNERSNEDTFLFVHGFNNSFKDAALQTAQIANDLLLERQPLMYSWASRGDLANYISDGDSVQRTGKNFARFLRAVLKNTGKGKVHLIAHSMGARAIVNLLADIDYYQIDRSKLGEVILLAADIDTSDFMENTWPKIKSKGIGITSYCSTKDLALQTSEDLRNGFPRLGQAGPGLTPIAGLTTIDAECSIDCGFCHNLTSLPCVLDDLTLFLTKKLDPDQRLLTKKEKNHLVYYETIEAHQPN